jgi:HPr kinase/phosphorylase
MDAMARATVFGLDVWSEEQLAVLSGAQAPDTGRVLDVLVDRRSNAAAWPGDGALISAQHEPDGTFALRIEAHEEAGFQLRGRRYGRHILSPDGRRLRCLPDGVARADWERFLIGQVLPFAAALNGLEVMHASAVSLGERALALLGPSGAGKTSLALALCRMGAGFLADDVLAIERDSERLLAHPGAPVAGVAHAEAARIGDRLHRRPVIAVNERERLVGVVPRRGPAVLGGMVFLDRERKGPAEPVIERVADTRALLSATFNFVLDDPERLERLLDVCAIAAQGPLARVRFGATVDPDRLAGAVAGWFESVR